MSPTLFQRLLGAEFYHLAPEVKALHAHAGHGRWRGVCRIERGGHPLARLACFFARLPPAMSEAPLSVEIVREGPHETWYRHFDGVPMRSRLRYDAGHLREQLGAMTFRFRLYRIDHALHWSTEGGRLFGWIPLPASWFEDVRCREFSEDGRYRFEVDARLPLLGRLIRYEGWLLPDEY
ncbi:DUF4166 domain-containing protein [Lysobacter pythonis]|uniref:DUF4166 domain-containing protein n=1 Tax=Solilutibacter pythonis TaxID=2483112 RepID=A0A3M2I2J3_9GAMM|nr:DUF4166 domain-containing protein [Lysobacter pythonis]RMH94190.1 DUF4166 domain-containing protein [Lysobacter pythonis]